MATKEPTASGKSLEEILAMEAETRAWRAEEARKAAEARRAAATPLLELAGGEAISTVLAALSEVDKLDEEQFPMVRTHVTAAKNGLNGLVSLAASIPQPVNDPATAEQTA